ncbi:MAG: phosphoenolpyruvate carboxykinase (GTP) [Candidatus Micrarchaeia archaeon]
MQAEEILEELRSINAELYNKVAKYIEILGPDSIVLIKGSKEEYNSLINEMLEAKELIELNKEKYPRCYLYRSSKDDVARTEECTYICTKSKDDVGPTNNWAEEDEMEAKLVGMLNGMMKGRTLYIVPYLLGPANSGFARAGVELTDSKYVVISEMIIAKVGLQALEHIKNSDFVFGINATGTIDPSKKYIAHFPSKNLLITINSAYGGNALLSKKNHALRIASYQAKNIGMLVEHMMSIEVIDPDGNSYGVAGAFPSSSGKTNLAMLRPPNGYEHWKVKLLSDDITWMLLSESKLMATNPEYGFFGVVPGTNEFTNPNAMRTITHDTIFTNVALNLENNTPWWEGLSSERPENILDWQGNKNTPGTAAHPNSRFTSPVSQYPELSESNGSAVGLGMHALLFGGRRKSLIPLVYESYSIEHGVLVGAMLRAESTAATVGKVGIIKNDPMAMRPFCGYNMADYFDHMRNILSKTEPRIRIFNVNWFRTNDEGKFIWPGFSDNMRVIKWVVERVNGKAKGIETPIGIIPSADEFDKGNISSSDMEILFSIDKEGWLKELEEVKPFFESFGDRLPKWLWDEYYRLQHRIESY